MEDKNQPNENVENKPQEQEVPVKEEKVEETKKENKQEEVKENKTEIKELQHFYGNWVKFRAGSLWKHDFAKRTPCEE